MAGMNHRTLAIGIVAFATVAVLWLMGLSGPRAIGADAPATDAGFEPLFNGKDLTGWEGDTSLWSAENGEIVGKSPGIKRNEFLASKERFGDFVLKFKFRIVNTSGQANSGMQFRSERVKDSTEMYGYQADVGQQYWGCLYDESRRKKVLAQPDKDALEKVLKRDDWNEYAITCQGDHITLELNGLKTVDYTETEPAEKVARSGLFGLQIHAGGPMEVHAKDIVIKKLPAK
jgi:hypothetical protein